MGQKLDKAIYRIASSKSSDQKTCGNLKRKLIKQNRLTVELFDEKPSKN